MLGKQTVFMRNGGSIPMVGDFAKHLGIPTILMGFGLPDDGLHSPNEKYKLANYYTGIMTIAHFFEEYGNDVTPSGPGTLAGGTRSAVTDSGQSESVVRSAGIVSIAVLTSRITGLVREIVMARLFGAGLIYDAFLLGFRIPNLTRDLFAEGAFSCAFVPIFTEYLATQARRQPRAWSNLVATALILLVGIVCALGVIFAPHWCTCWLRASPRCPANSSWPSR